MKERVDYARCMIPGLVNKSKKTLREESFQVNGPRLLNSIPGHVRGMTRCNIDNFKIQKFLETVPDEPRTKNLVPSATNQINGNPSNSIIDQARRNTR